MPLIKPNRELDRLLEDYPLQIIAFGMNDAWFVMPMPRQLLKENHAVYWHRGNAYAIIELLNPAKYRARFISTK
jgi:hypothetical protein